MIIVFKNISNVLQAVIIDSPKSQLNLVTLNLGGIITDMKTIKGFINEYVHSVKLVFIKENAQDFC